MSIETGIILSHFFDDSNILSVPEYLNADQGELLEVMTDFATFSMAEYPYRNERSDWHWYDGPRELHLTMPSEVWWESSGVMLAGPGLTAIHFGRTTCSISLGVWTALAKFEDWQSRMRKVCSVLAQKFGSDKAIYFPDSGPWQVQQALDGVGENYTFSEIEEWLLQNIGQPAETLEAADDQLMIEGNELGSYYIDDFADLK